MLVGMMRSKMLLLLLNGHYNHYNPWAASDTDIMMFCIWMFLHHKRLPNTRLEQRRRDATEKRNNNQFFSELKHFIFLHKAKHIETNFYPSLKCQNFQFSMFLYGFIGKFCNKLQLRCDDDIDQFVWMLRERLAGLMKILIDIDIEW